MWIEKHTRLAREEGAQQFFLRQLARRFGALPEAVTARVMDAGGEELERWSDRIRALNARPKACLQAR
jgi:hypothetical protein